MRIQYKRYAGDGCALTGPLKRSGGQRTPGNCMFVSLIRKKRAQQHLKTDVVWAPESGWSNRGWIYIIRSRNRILSLRDKLGHMARGEARGQKTSMYF